jgi:predicted regulator of Ras-like GTPase activity (Roadblock/LC7/MglB family)
MSALALSNKQQQLQQSLRDLASQKGVIGAVLVSRDGIRVLEFWKRDMWNKETFSAMSATLMGAAEVALSELGGDKTGRVIAETSKKKMVVMGPSEELLLVVVGEADHPLEALLPQCEATAAIVSKIVAA